MAVRGAAAAKAHFRLLRGAGATLRQTPSGKFRKLSEKWFYCSCLSFLIYGESVCIVFRFIVLSFSRLKQGFFFLFVVNVIYKWLKNYICFHMLYQMKYTLFMDIRRRYGKLTHNNLGTHIIFPP